MAANPPSNATQVARILYKEIFAGDLRKIEAKSNDSDTGGGARDFRFGSYKQLTKVIKIMFPQVVQEIRKRDGVSKQIDVYKGQFHWKQKGANVSKDSFFEPPTDARGSEGRIARVHEYPCFDAKLIPKAGEGNRVLLMLIQRNDGSVWPHFASESSLRSKGIWDTSVAKALIECLDAQRPEGRAVIGYRDFTTAESYCNGK